MLEEGGVMPNRILESNNGQVERRSYDGQLASTTATLMAHKEETNRRFEEVRDDIKSVTTSVVDLGKTQDVKMTDMTKEINSLSKKLAYILGGIVVGSKVLEMVAPHAFKALVGG